MEYILKNREVISFAVAAHSVILVNEGVLWLTGVVDSSDHLLQSGSNFEIHGKSIIVMEALADCTFSVLCSDRESWQVTVRQSLFNHKQFA